MIYKFDTPSRTNTYLEFQAIENDLVITAGDYDNEILCTQHHLVKEDIDEMILALTNIKNEIAEYERKNS